MSAFIAALPMYDWPELRAETDARWARLRDALRAEEIDAPAALARRNADLPAAPGGIRDGAGGTIAPDPATLAPDDLDLPTLWRHPALLFAQCCWGPIETTGLGAHVRVIGQPDYSDVEGGEGESYRSAILMRRDGRKDKRSTLPPSGLPAISPTRGEIGLHPRRLDFFDVHDWRQPRRQPISPSVGEMAGRPEGGNVRRGPLQTSNEGDASIPLDLLRGRRLAFNSDDSMSGILALTRDLEALGDDIAIFSERVETGGHRASIHAVAEGRADVCAIDCRSWAMARRFEPTAQALEAVGWTARRKGLPFITAGAQPERIVAVLTRVLAASGEIAAGR